MRHGVCTVRSEHGFLIIVADVTVPANESRAFHLGRFSGDGGYAGRTKKGTGGNRGRALSTRVLRLMDRTVLSGPQRRRSCRRHRRRRRWRRPSDRRRCRRRRARMIEIDRYRDRMQDRVRSRVRDEGEMRPQHRRLDRQRNVEGAAVVQREDRHAVRRVVLLLRCRGRRRTQLYPLG